MINFHPHVSTMTHFYYDADYRLDHSTLNGTLNLQMTYDTTGMGNIASRSDVAGGTAWTYDPVRKHAVTQAGTGGYSYTYDGNGNATSRNGYTATWTSYNYVSGINSSGESATFQYGPDRQRWKTIYTGSIGTETTYHVGKLLEKVANGGVLDYRHYIYAGNELVAIASRMSTGTNTVRYVLGDHQSSYSSLVSSTGTPIVGERFTAYGNRRSGETWFGAPSSGDETAINGVSRQGYTGGQTTLGVSMGLNHMNGRIEDAVTGRFLSPDPYVPNPGNTQSFNRYSYVNNNPLTYMDPAGFDPCAPGYGGACPGADNGPADGSGGGGDGGGGDPDPSGNPPDQLPPVGCGIPPFGPCTPGPQTPAPSANPPLYNPPSPPLNGNLSKCLRSVVFCNSPAQSPKPNPCPGIGNAPSPQQFANQGQAMQQAVTDVAQGGDPAANLGASLVNLFNLFNFRRGGSLDAQSYGSTPAYGNYAYGTYMAANGRSFSTTLSGANLFGTTSNYNPAYVRSQGGYDPLYPNLPVSNTQNIISGFLQQQNGSLCTKP